MAKSYSLNSESTRLAKAQGLINAAWYKPPIERKLMKELMQRQDLRPALDIGLWWFLLIASGLLSYHYRDNPWLFYPLLMVYGVLYGSVSDSKQHECGHGTAFKTPVLNQIIYHISCFMLLRNNITNRASHARHHTDTIIVGSDPEIVTPRPPSWKTLLNILDITHLATVLPAMIRLSFGRISPEEADFTPASEHRYAILTARIWLLLFIGQAVIVWQTGNVYWLVYFGVLPAAYGAWLMYYFGISQHVGLAENVTDHRLNSRTIYMNPIFRFVYSNMNYHCEHHLFPLVPYYNLPRLHEALKPYLPPPYPSTIAAYREIIPTLWKQLSDESYFVTRPLPQGETNGLAKNS